MAQDARTRSINNDNTTTTLKPQSANDENVGWWHVVCCTILRSLSALSIGQAPHASLVNHQERTLKLIHLAHWIVVAQETSPRKPKTKGHRLAQVCERGSHAWKQKYSPLNQVLWSSGMSRRCPSSGGSSSDMRISRRFLEPVRIDGRPAAGVGIHRRRKRRSHTRRAEPSRVSCAGW